MKLQYSVSIAAASILVMLAPAFCGTRPHYGGTLRIESRDMVTSLDSVWTAPNTVLQQQLSELLFDRLTRVNDNGRAQPALALNWRANSELSWEFHLRWNVRFADDQPLSAQIAAVALCKTVPQWKCTARDPLTLIIDTDEPVAHLPELLALPEFSITKLDADQKVMGTGAFRVETFQAARRIVLSANDDYWNGRPYLDKVEIVMGGTVRDQLINRRLDIDDVVELGLEQARTIGYGASGPVSAGSQRLAVSEPSDLYALVFFRAPVTDPATPLAAPRVDDPRIREAVALTLDRSAISRVILQKQGETAPSLLPEWMTGYGFLFTHQPDLERARKLRGDAFRNASVSIPLAYDAGDATARAIAERIAVNAREANITFQPFGERNLTLDSASATGAQAVLVRLPLASSSPSAALTDLAMRTGLPTTAIAQVESASNTESLYAAERGALESFRIIPVAHVPQIFWLSPRVRDWKTPDTGGWRLDDVWVEGERPSSPAAAVLR